MSSFLESPGLFQALPHCQSLLASFTLDFSMLCYAWDANKEADRDPLALALETLQPQHGCAIPLQRGQAWQVPWVPFQQWFWSSCVAFSLGLSPTPGLGHTVTTSSLWDVVAALFSKAAACISSYTLPTEVTLHTYSMSFPRYLSVPCAYWITEQSVSGNLNIRRTAFNTQSELSPAKMQFWRPQLL